MKYQTSTKDKIIDSARRLFAASGFDSASMSDIAKKIGINKASIYYFFENKEHIYGAIINDILGGIDELLKGVGDGKISILEFMEGLVKIGRVNGTVFEMSDIKKMSKDCNFCPKVAKRIGNIRDMFGDILEKKGVADPYIKGELVLNSLHGYIINSLHSKTLSNPSEYCRHLVKTFHLE